MKGYIRRVLPLAVGILSLTCVRAADTQKPVSGPAAVSSARMVIEHEPEETAHPHRTSVLKRRAPEQREGSGPVAITETVLANGLIMAEGAEAFRSAMTVSRSEDGTLSFGCGAANHPGHAHAHGAGVVKGGAEVR